MGEKEERYMGSTGETTEKETGRYGNTEVERKAEAENEETVADDRKKTEEWNRWKKRSAVCTAISVMLYICCVVPPIICEGLGWNESIGAACLFLFVAVATGILIMNRMTRPALYREWENPAQGEGCNRRCKAGKYLSSFWSLVVVLYLFFSFYTWAWQVTWLIFPIGAAIASVFKTCFGEGTGVAARVMACVCSILSLLMWIVLIVYFAVFFLQGKNISFPFLNGTVYAGAENYTEGNISYEPVSGLEEIHINWTDGTVRVEAAEDIENIEIMEEESEEMQEEDRVHSYYHDGILEIRYRESGNYFFQSHASDKRLHIRIPISYAQELDKVRTDVVGTDVTFTGLTADSLDVDGVSGMICYTGTVSENLELGTVSGDAVLELFALPKKVKTDSVSGNVTLILPQDASFEAEIDSVSGNMHCTYSDAETLTEKGRIIRGDGKSDLTFDSVSGNVELRPAS